MSDKKNLSLEEKEQLVEVVRTYPCLYDKSKKECKDKNVCENAWEKVIEKLEFIENGKCRSSRPDVFYKKRCS